MYCDTSEMTIFLTNSNFSVNGYCTNYKNSHLDKALFWKEVCFFFCITECREGWHGINCSQQCVGHCRDVATCNHVTGQCDTGCAAGWTGLQCMKGSINA